MTLKAPAKAADYTKRDMIRLLTRREVDVARRQVLDELLDIGSPGGPVVPRGQIRMPKC